MLIKRYNKIVNAINFTSGLRDLRKEINFRIDIPESITFFPNSNPKGFIKEFKKRRATIVESYLKITQNIESGNSKERDYALRLLAEHINYPSSLKMPLNTARVQMALMKEVVKNRDNKRLQLELLHDFSASTYGHPRVIRKLLKRFDIMEVPETGEELRNLKMGWDFHVHDHTSYGRKSPMQIIIDSFIKGISEITVIYTSAEHKETIKEVLNAGKILGINVNIGIEFSAKINNKKFHFIYVLPEFASEIKRFDKFIKNRSESLTLFMEQLSNSSKRRKHAIRQMIDKFNNQYLPQINEGYQPGSIYYMQPIQLPENDEFDKNRLHSARQLGELVYPYLKNVIENRALRLLAIIKRSKTAPHLFTTQQTEKIEAEYNRNKRYYNLLDPELIRIKYFSEYDYTNTTSAVEGLKEVFLMTKKTGGSIKFIQPLEHGLQSAIDLIIEQCEYLSYTEVFNIYDTIGVKVSDFETLTNFVELFNSHNKKQITTYLENNKLTYNCQILDKALLHMQNKTMIPAIGSDATGRSTLAPGMGFVTENQLPKKNRNYFKKRHINLPQKVSQLVYNYSPIPKSTLKHNKKANIISLGKVDKNIQHQIGDEKNEKPINALKAWIYLHPTIRNLIFSILGFIPAYIFLGINYACIWFIITGTRNIVVDIISGNGLRPHYWHLNSVDWTNLAHSLFWTGFSVPILGFVKTKFDMLWAFDHSGSLYETTKFFFINIANGLYLASHNYLRGFDKATIRGNLFRSLIAWPFATAFSPIGYLLGMPSIVQAKFWSDFVAAIIEGTTKYKKILRLKDKVIKKVIPDIVCDNEEASNLATLDLLYLTEESVRAKTAFLKQSFKHLTFKQKIVNLIHKRKTPSEPKEIYFLIKQHFQNTSNYNNLTNYIVSRYNKEHSLFLLQLLARNYDKFTRWLVSLQHQKQ